MRGAHTAAMKMGLEGRVATRPYPTPTHFHISNAVTRGTRPVLVLSRHRIAVGLKPSARSTKADEAA